MDITCIALGIIFLAFGAAFASEKVHIHTSVWKTMPTEEKEKIRITPLCRNIGEVIMLSGLIFLLKGLLKGFSEHMFTFAMIAWLIFAGIDVWHISKSGRYLNR